MWTQCVTHCMRVFIGICHCACVCSQNCTLIASYHAMGMSSVCLSDSIPIVRQLISSTAALRCAVRGSMPGRSPLFTSIHFSSLLASFVVFQRHSLSLFNSVQSAQLIKLSLMLFINTSSTSWHFYSSAFARTIALSYPSARLPARNSALPTWRHFMQLHFRDFDWNLLTLCSSGYSRILPDIWLDTCLRLRNLELTLRQTEQSA